VAVSVTLAQSTVLLADGGKSAGLTVLVYGLGDPVDLGITANSFVRGINQDNLVVLVYTVLVNPVRIKDAEVTASASNTLFSSGTEGSLELEVVDTLADGLAVGGTLGSGLFAVTTTDTDAVDDIALLGLVPKAAGLVGPRRTRCAVDDV